MTMSAERAGFLVFAVCLAYSQTLHNLPGFDAASIKPHSDTGESRTAAGGGVITSKVGAASTPRGGGALYFRPGAALSGRQGVTARKIILEAYRLTSYQLSGGPGWLDIDAFDLEAKAETASENQLRQMLQTLLAERFQLTVHHETRQMPVYALMVGKNGPKLREWKQGDPVPSPAGHARGVKFAGTMQTLTNFLSTDAPLGRPVLDKTGLNGAYIFTFGWETDDDFIHAIQEQFGLKLESQRAALDALVIDRIQKPSSN